MSHVAVGFDFDHTLGVDHKLECSAFVEFMRDLTGASGFDETAVAAVADERIAQYRAGASTFAHAFEAAYETVLQGRQPPVGAFAAYQLLVLDRAPEHVKPLPGAAELLQRLDRDEIPYAILTNGWNPLQQRKAELIGFTRPVLVSDDLGARKPSVQAFDALRDCLALPPDAIWYVGDDAYNDILGALGAGMRAIWFDWEEKKYPTNVPAPTAVVTQLLEVLDIIA